MIDRKKDTLYFLAIERTGTRTLHNILREIYGAAAFVPNNHSIFDYLEIPEKERRRHRYISSHWCYQVQNVLGIKPKTITLLRNPIDRIFSHYALLKTHGLTDAPNITRFVTAPENHWICHNFQIRSLCFDTWDQDKIDTERRHFGEQPHDWFCCNRGDDHFQFGMAVSRLQQMELVGVTERFGDMLTSLYKKLDVEPLVNWRVFNASEHKPKRTELPAEVFDELCIANALDFALWEVAQNLLDASLFWAGLGAKAQPDAQ